MYEFAKLFFMVVVGTRRPNPAQNIFKQVICNDMVFPIFRHLIHLYEINHTSNIRMIQILDRVNNPVGHFHIFLFDHILDKCENLRFW